MTQDDQGFTPQAKNSPDGIGPLHRAAPPKVTVINKKAVLILSIAVIGVIIIAFSSLVQPEQKQAESEKTHETTPVAGENINSLPTNYTDVTVKKLGPPRPGEFGVAQVQQERGLKAEIAPAQPNEAERAADAALAQKIREANEATHSKIKFNVVDNSQNSQKPLQENDINLLKALTDKKNDSGGFGKQVDITRDADNRQDDKTEFTSKKRTIDPYLKQAVVHPQNPYFVASGSIIPGVMITGINSDLPGTITGQVSQNVFDTISGRYLLIPQGTKIVGEYSSIITYGQERVQVIWTRILFPNGTSISLEGMPGVDLAGYSGLTDQVNNHYMKLLGGVVLSSLISATGQMAQGGTSQLNPTFPQLATQGAAQNVNDAGQKITQKNLNIQPTLEIRQGMRFNIMVQHDIELPPYTNN